MKHDDRCSWFPVLIALTLLSIPSCAWSRFGMPPGPLVLPDELTLGLVCDEDRRLVLSLSNTALRSLELVSVDVLSAASGLRDGMTGIPLSFRLSCPLNLGPGEIRILEYLSGEPGSPPSEYLGPASEFRIYRVNGHPWPSPQPAPE